MARGHLEEGGFGSQVEYRVGPAVDSLEQLAQEGRTFDFFFIDADKENYPVYLDYAIRLARPGAVIVGDNCFLRGRTLNRTSKARLCLLCVVSTSRWQVTRVLSQLCFRTMTAWHWLG